MHQIMRSSCCCILLLLLLQSSVITAIWPFDQKLLLNRDPSSTRLLGVGEDCSPEEEEEHGNDDDVGFLQGTWRSLVTERPRCGEGLMCVPRGRICLPMICITQAAFQNNQNMDVMAVDSYLNRYGRPETPLDIDFEGLVELVNDGLKQTVDSFRADIAHCIKQTKVAAQLEHDEEKEIDMNNNNNNIDVNGDTFFGIFPTIYAGFTFEFVGGFGATRGFLGGGGSVTIVRAWNDTDTQFLYQACAGAEGMASGNTGIGIGAIVGAATTRFISQLEARSSSYGINIDGPGGFIFPGLASHIAIVPGWLGPRFLDLYFTKTLSLGFKNKAGGGFFGGALDFKRGDSSSSSSSSDSGDAGPFEGKEENDSSDDGLTIRLFAGKVKKDGNSGGGIGPGVGMSTDMCYRFGQLTELRARLQEPFQNTVQAVTKKASNIWPFSRFLDPSADRLGPGESCSTNDDEEDGLIRSLINRPACADGLVCLPRGRVCMPLSCIAEAAFKNNKGLNVTVAAYLQRFGRPSSPLDIQFDGIMDMLDEGLKNRVDNLRYDISQCPGMSQVAEHQDDVTGNGSPFGIFPTMYAGFTFEFTGGFGVSSGIAGVGGSVSVVRAWNSTGGKFMFQTCATGETMVSGNSGVGIGTIIGAASTDFISDLGARSVSHGLSMDGPGSVIFPGLSGHIALVPGYYGPRLLDLYFTTTLNLGPGNGGNIDFIVNSDSSDSRDSDDQGGLAKGEGGGFDFGGAGLSLDMCYRLGSLNQFEVLASIKDVVVEAIAQQRSNVNAFVQEQRENRNGTSFFQQQRTNVKDAAQRLRNQNRDI